MHGKQSASYEMWGLTYFAADWMLLVRSDEGE